MTAEMEFIKLFPYLSGFSTTSPHDMDNLLDELSLDVAEVLVKIQDHLFHRSIYRTKICDRVSSILELITLANFSLLIRNEWTNSLLKKSSQLM